MRRILVVDDDAIIRESIRLALDLIGVEAILADSGDRALEAFGQASFDGVIVDLMMPGMDGLATIRALRARAPGLPVIVVSGSILQDSLDAPELMRMATELPGVTSLSKPFKLSDRLHTVRARFGEAAVPLVPSAKPAA